jgi:hypothetical protein
MQTSHLSDRFTSRLWYLEARRQTLRDDATLMKEVMGQDDADQVSSGDTTGGIGTRQSPWRDKLNVVWRRGLGLRFSCMTTARTVQPSTDSICNMIDHDMARRKGNLPL